MFPEGPRSDSDGPGAKDAEHRSERRSRPGAGLAMGEAATTSRRLKNPVSPFGDYQDLPVRWRAPQAAAPDGPCSPSARRGLFYLLRGKSKE
jgi:hypothetical protein